MGIGILSIRRSDLAWLIDLTTLIAVILGLSFAGMELRQLRAEQESQTVLQLVQVIRSDEYIRAVALLQELPEGLNAEQLRDRLTEEDQRLVLQLQLTYEAMGLMVYRGDVSLDWVDELFRYMVLMSWTKLEPLTIEERESTGYLGINEWHQWLAERMLDRTNAQPVPAYEAFSDWSP